MRNVLLLLLLAHAAHAAASHRVPVMDLVSRPQDFDGREVTIEGEAIGDIFRARDGFWVNLLDGTVAIGVWIPPEHRPEIRTLGKYGVRGDQVEVTGIFRHRCPEHLGDTDIHARDVSVLARGFSYEHPIQWRQAAGILLFGTLSLVCILLLHLRSAGGSSADPEK